MYNLGEAFAVETHVRDLLAAGVTPASIAVVSPYAAQVALLKNALSELEVEVATVDGWLPTSSTCARQMQLPAYTSSCTLRSQLLGAQVEPEARRCLRRRCPTRRSRRSRGVPQTR